MKLFLSIFLIMVLGISGNVWGGNLNITSNINSKESQFSDKELPNPVSAGVVAVFPGFIIHGSGHFYLGDYYTGGLLLGSEVGGIILWFALVFGSNCLASDKVFCAEVIPGNILFWGSWLYDVIVAPIKASKMRKEYEQRKKDNQIAPELGFLPSENFKGGKLALTWRF